MPQLIFNIEKEYPRVHDLVDAKISIGSGKDNDILLEDSSVAALHVELTREESGSYALKNLDPGGNTTVNGERVKDTFPLKNSHRIRLGSVKALFLEPQENPHSDTSQNLKSLIRKDEIERNNLRLLENDSKWVRSEIEKFEKQKEELEGELDHLNKEVEAAKLNLAESRTESEKLAGVIAKSKTFQEEFDQLEIELKTRKSSSEKLSRKILDGEKRYADLDLENSVKRKEQLDIDLEALTKEIDKSKAELDENRRASEEAASIFEDAKKIEAEIRELEAQLKSRKNDYEELEQAISDREKTCLSLDSQIADCHSELETLTIAFTIKQEEVSNLAKTVLENENLIRSAGEKLTEVESKIQKSREDVFQFQATQKSLEKESLTLNRIVSEKSAVLQRLKEKLKSGGKVALVSPPLRLINPGMGSLIHYFHHGAGTPDESRYDPVGFPAFAACTRGSMHRDADSIMPGTDPVLFLPSGDWEKDRARIDAISESMPERILLLFLGEGQFKPLTEQLGPELSSFLSGIAGFISIDPETAQLVEKSGTGRPHINLPSPCPVDAPDWDLSVPISDRTRGIFVCGDGFDPDSQIHQTRIEFLNRLVAETKTTVTFYQNEPITINGLNLPDEQIQGGQGPLKYSDYLRLAGQHFLVTGFGKNFAGGDVTGDAILSRTLFIGADQENNLDQLLFPDTCIIGKNFETALENAAQLLSDKAVFHEVMEQNQSLAAQLVSFESVRERLGEFIHSISGNPV